MTRVITNDSDSASNIHVLFGHTRAFGQTTPKKIKSMPSGNATRGA